MSFNELAYAVAGASLQGVVGRLNKGALFFVPTAGLEVTVVGALIFRAGQLVLE